MKRWNLHYLILQKTEAFSRDELYELNLTDEDVVVLLSMPVGTGYIDRDGDRWERTA